MKTVTLALVLTLLALGHAFSLRQLVGICVEMCSSDADCQPGHHCLSNGCGHTCQARVHILPIGGGFNCDHICNAYCPNGHLLDSNGCPTCACNPGGDIVVAS